MNNKVLKRLIASISATTLAATSLGFNTVLAANAENTTPVGHVHEAEELTEAAGHSDCHDDCCDHAHGGKGVTIALLDAGVTNSETAGKTSFIDDDTIGSDHGNNMMDIISGVAPEADVLDVRVLDDEGKGTYETVEKGIRWSVDNNADIIVMSFVGEKQSALLESALAYAEEHEVLVVASAGNYSSSTALYPAAYPTVISVGALDENGKIQDYSNFGDYVDTYVEWSDGTSGAAQYIAATAAVTMEQNSGISISELRASYSTADKSLFAGSAEDNADTVVYSAAKCKSHTFNGSYTTTKNPTCTSAGEKVGKCVRCGTVVSRVSIPALGHNWGSYTTTKNPTCTAAGTKTRKCSRCGASDSASISATGHSFNGSYTTSKNATCTAAGEKVGKCTKCGTVVSRVSIPALGHNLGGWTRTKNPSCTSAGSEVRKCTRCGSVGQSRAVSALGHSWGSYSTTKNPTCTAAGTKTRKCSRCGASDSASIPATGHSFNGSYTTTKNPTCTAAGEKVGKCTKCGTVVSKVAVPALGHSWGAWTTTKKPTCTAAGAKTRKCTRCGAVENGTVPAAGHKFNGSYTTTKQPTCTAAGEKIGKCTVCGTVVSKVAIAALGHDYQWVVVKDSTCTATGTKQYKCKRCGHISKTETIAKKSHTFNGSYTITKQPTCTATGTKVGKCTKCGTVVSTVTVPALGHNWSAWTTTKKPTCTAAGSKTHKCTRCGKTETATIAATGHKFNGSYTITKQPTCTAAGEKVGKCTVCGAVVSRVKIPAAHKWGAWTVTKKATCTENGSKKHTCSVCKKVETAVVAKLGGSHQFNGSYTVTKQPTCTAAGEKVGKCTRCGTIITRVKIPAAHKWGAWTTTKKATCTAAGTKKHTCTVCKKTATATIPKLGGSHQFNGSYTVTKQPTCTTAGEKIGRCTRCGDIITRVKIPATHKWGAWTVTKQRTCTENGSKKRTCSVCKKTETATIAKLGGTHQFNGSYTTIKQPTCTTAGEKVGKCTRCGAIITRVKIPATHKWGAWTVTKKATCTANGTKKRTCTVCKATQIASVPKLGGSLQFNGSFETKQPTCTENGYRRGRCTRCGEIVTNTVIPKLGGSHNYGNWYCDPSNPGVCSRKCSKCNCVSTTPHSFNGSFETTMQPTCIDPGEKVGKCTRCGHIVTTVTIPATGYRVLGTTNVNGTSTQIIMVDPGQLSVMQSRYPNAVIIQDDVQSNGYVNYQVRDSYKITSLSEMSAICDMIIDYNADAGRTDRWNRSNAGCVAEWVEHNALYLVPNGDIQDCARHVDLDADASGTPAGLFSDH